MCTADVFTERISFALHVFIHTSVWIYNQVVGARQQVCYSESERKEEAKKKLEKRLEKRGNT